VPHITAEAGAPGGNIARTMGYRRRTPCRLASTSIHREVHVQRTRLTPLTVLAAFALLAGCDTRVSTEPLQTQVVNLPNDLALQVTGLEAATEQLVYSWQNDSTTASVVQAPTNLTGNALLFILDGAGTQVYQRSLAENGTFTTTAGVPGNWTVRVRLEDVSGAVTLRVKNP
jgi:hypothetical protein